MSSIAVTVFLRPRPPHPQYGPHWMPLGGVLPYGPFHSLQGLIPDDATERIDVECSPDLWAHWQEFYDEIQPIFVFPPSDSPIRDHWRYILSNFDTYHNKSRECEVRIGTAMIARYAPAAVVDSEKKRLTALGRIMDADFSNMDNNTIERKMWVCILCEIIQCRRDFESYFRHIQRCSGGWDKMSAVTSLVMSGIKNHFSSWQTPATTLPPLPTLIHDSSLSLTSSSPGLPSPDLTADTAITIADHDGNGNESDGMTVVRRVRRWKLVNDM
ncbi:hypothetical protein B0H13DRAFT_2017843 [Mycena leptocephala]|nr:hypothetical protein B0H13DRAFT_2017843 [Mycena leptocephala]